MDVGNLKEMESLAPAPASAGHWNMPTSQQQAEQVITHNTTVGRLPLKSWSSPGYQSEA